MSEGVQRRFHVVGIGGAGMSAVARLLLAHGSVSGSDNGRWPLSEGLRPLGVTVHDSFNADHVRDADVVVRSSAFGEDNVEVRAARELGITVWKREDAWRLLAKGKRVVAVAGTHGKTTTTAMTWMAVGALGSDPSLICGGELVQFGKNAHLGRGDVLVIEADEYDRTFHGLEPTVAVVLNVDHDHVDQFPTRAEYAEAFREFVKRIPSGGTLVACADDPGALDLSRWARATRPGRVVLTYGFSSSADRRFRPGVSSHSGTSAEPSLEMEPRSQSRAARAHPGDRPGRDGQLLLFSGDGREIVARLHVPGEHNVLNAAAAIVAAGALGVPVRAAGMGLSMFLGTGRRLETLGSVADVTVVDDYAHHPAEIRASILAVRPARSLGRLVVLFQPHTPSRLAAFFREFADAFAGADAVVIAETFSSAREPADESGNARSLAEQIGARYAADPEDAARILAELVRTGDVVLVLGAGDIRRAGERLLELLRERAAV